MTSLPWIGLYLSWRPLADLRAVSAIVCGSHNLCGQEPISSLHGDSLSGSLWVLLHPGQPHSQTSPRLGSVSQPEAGVCEETEERALAGFRGSGCH